MRHNGGSVWFDELGPPWNKHGCFDDDSSGMGLRSALVQRSQASAARPVFGVVIETVAARPGQGGRIVVRCSDGRIVDGEFNTTLDLVKLVGQIVIVERGDADGIRLVSIVPPPGSPP